jgi:predicted O-methyltransferase YrrM
MSEHQFCTALMSLLSAEQVTGRTGKVFGREMLASNSTRNNLAVLARLMEERQPKRTLEIGFAFGASALVLADAHRRLAHGSACHTAIDAWEVDGWDAIGLDNVEAAGWSGYLDLRNGLSAIELPKLMQDGRTFGLIYIDGSHEFDDVFVDACFCTRLLEPDGIMLFDDSSHPPVAKVLRLMRADKRLLELDLTPYRRHASIRTNSRASWARHSLRHSGWLKGPEGPKQ